MLASLANGKCREKLANFQYRHIFAYFIRRPGIKKTAVAIFLVSCCQLVVPNRENVVV